MNGSLLKTTQQGPRLWLALLLERAVFTAHLSDVSLGPDVLGAPSSAGIEFVAAAGLLLFRLARILIASYASRSDAA